MANPTIVNLPEGEWVKVATNVVTGYLYISDRHDRRFFRTYRVTGDPAPTPGDMTDAVPYNDNGFEDIDDPDYVDVYLMCVSPEGENGSVRVAV